MKSKMPYTEARALADQLVAQLAPACERIEVAGSIRRKKEEVGDIEIVAIPKMETIRNLFGEAQGEVSLLNVRLSDMGWDVLKNGDKYKQFVLPGGISLDLFICRLATWGVIYTIRTGSADFTHWLVTNRQHGGG